MASDQKFVDFVVEQIEYGGDITAKKMFGEYALYVDGKIFALICDNKLFIKPIEASLKYIGTPTEAPPYPGSKNYYLIEENIEDRDWFSGLVKTMAPELPEPKPKKKKK